MPLTIRHSTTYRYDQPVVYALQRLRLRPLTSVTQVVREWRILIDGGRNEASYTDHHGNHVDLISLDPWATEVTIKAEGVVEPQESTGIFGQVYGAAPLWHFRNPTALTTPDSAISSLAKMVNPRGDLLGSLHALSAEILKSVPYRIGETAAGTSASMALAQGAGVCQDHAQIFVSACRVAGLPARYVSGYLLMDDRIDQDATHAWAETHVDGLGWVGFRRVQRHLAGSAIC